MKYIFGLALFFGTVFQSTGESISKLMVDDRFELFGLKLYQIIPISNFVIYFLLVFLIFKAMKLKTNHLKDKKLIVFNIGLITTSFIWFLWFVKVSFPLETFLYTIDVKNFFHIPTLLLFLGILVFLLETRKEVQNACKN